jgi:hypothetical protein
MRLMIVLVLLLLLLLLYVLLFASLLLPPCFLTVLRADRCVCLERCLCAAHTPPALLAAAPYTDRNINIVYI